jgi:predicted dehydrogenase
MGKRGKHHALAFKNNPRFELAGICTRDANKLAKAAAELGISGHPATRSRSQEKFGRTYFAFAPRRRCAWT